MKTKKKEPARHQRSAGQIKRFSRPLVALFRWFINPKGLKDAFCAYPHAIRIALIMMGISFGIGFFVRPAFVQQEWEAALLAIREPPKSSLFGSDTLPVDLESLFREYQRQHDQPEIKVAPVESVDRRNWPEWKVLVVVFLFQVPVIAVWSLIAIVTGFMLGLYPTYLAVTNGLWFGFCYHRLFADGAAQGMIIFALFLPLVLAVVVALVLSTAAGLHMSAFVVKKHKGAWFKTELWEGIVLWAKVILPIILLGAAVEVALFCVLSAWSG